jgi:hypothetical protein
VRSEAHENKRPENEHRRDWDEPAEIQPSGVRRFALSGLRFGTRAGYSVFGLPGNACHVQGNCWNWPRTREGWFKRKIGGMKLLACICARHRCELFAAARTCGEMKFVSGGFVDAQRLVEIRGQEFGVGAIAGPYGVARKTSPEEAIHCVFVVLRWHDAILLL